MALVGSVLNISELFVQTGRHPKSPGEFTDFERLLHIGYVRMMKLTGIYFSAQTATPPSLLDVPGLYIKSGGAATFESAIENIVAAQWELLTDGGHVCRAFQTGVYLKKYTDMKQENKADLTQTVVSINPQPLAPGTSCTYCCELATKINEDGKPVCDIPGNH
jgi:hypothetical protein